MIGSSRPRSKRWKRLLKSYRMIVSLFTSGAITVDHAGHDEECPELASGQWHIVQMELKYNKKINKLVQKHGL